MLLVGMKPQELLAEVSDDLKKIAAWFPSQHAIAHRWMLKQKLPAWFCTQYKSARNNVWKIMWEIQSRKFPTGALVEYTTINGKHGRFVIKPQISAGGFFIILYIPHFFKRYRERMKLGDKLKPEQLIRRYLRNNTSGINTGKKLNIEVTTKEGIALGNVIYKRLVIINTFITYDMSYGKQVERFNDGRERADNVGYVEMYDEDVVSEMREIGIDAKDFATKVQEKVKEKLNNNNNGI
jgi:hypothetical protein